MADLNDKYKRLNRQLEALQADCDRFKYLAYEKYPPETGIADALGQRDRAMRLERQLAKKDKALANNISEILENGVLRKRLAECETNLFGGQELVDNLRQQLAAAQQWASQLEAALRDPDGLLPQLKEANAKLKHINDTFPEGELKAWRTYTEGLKRELEEAQQRAEAERDQLKMDKEELETMYGAAQWECDRLREMVKPHSYRDKTAYQWHDEAMSNLKRWHEEVDEINRKYHELLYAVGNKYHGETRHQTALRYIREREYTSSRVGSMPAAERPERNARGT